MGITFWSTNSTLWNELKSSCDFLKARKEVEKFNFHNRWKKRGVAMVPTKFGISFTTKFMNQGALVQVYTDGTVLVAHRGVEMGQGLHTKVAQAPIITVQTDWTSTPMRAHDRLSSRSCGWWMEGKECIHVNQAGNPFSN
ncbi:unnamed protein product [Camellia sinensis]